MMSVVSFPSGSSLRAVATFPLPRGVSLVIAQGSVVDFEPPVLGSVGAIVNAANEGCLGGGGVDGAISSAGGPNLARDRRNLPVMMDRSIGVMEVIRCPTGEARLTGPNDYDQLRVPYVVHAVGPRYYEYDSFGRPNRILYFAYQYAMECCRHQNQNLPAIEHLGFSLLSAGLFRGDQSLLIVLRLAIRALTEYLEDGGIKGRNNRRPNSEQEIKLKTVTLCAFTPKEVRGLLRACEIEGLEQVKPKPTKPVTIESDDDDKNQESELEEDSGVAVVSQDPSSAVGIETMLKDHSDSDEEKAGVTVVSQDPTNVPVVDLMPKDASKPNEVDLKPASDASTETSLGKKGKNGALESRSPQKKPRLQ